MMTAVAAPEQEAYVETRVVPSKYATQAAAVDGAFLYAVASKQIAKIDRATGREIALSEGEASHLNSAVVLEGRIYCAHSNFPLLPETSEVRILDPETMKLTVFHEFQKPPGSLTWVLKKGGDWWCHFAHYGKDNAKSVLLRYDTEWKETGRWHYPEGLVAEWGKMSLSGGIWQGEELLVTGHDKKSIYRVKVPVEGGMIEWMGTHPSPFPGQGIAEDPQTGGLVGIDRKRKSVVFAELEKR